MDEFEDCELCSDICDSPKIWFRGYLPCDILFIGEAPGPAERALRIPFVGPAGRRLNDWIARSSPPEKLRWAFTNTVICYPKDERIDKFRTPTTEEVDNCFARLVEFIELADPKGLVFVGKVARSTATRIVKQFKLPEVSIVHPAATLRGDLGDTHLTCKKQWMKIAKLTEEITDGA